MSYGSFGMRDGHFVRYGANVRIVPGNRPRRRYHRRRRQPPVEPSSRQMSAPSPSSLSETAREVLASPAARRAIAGAITGFIVSGPKGALSGALGGALGPPEEPLALPPPPEE